MNMTYADAGVNYAALDPFKLETQSAAQTTDTYILGSGFEVEPWTRGESCFLVRLVGGQYFGFVVEGLGTKSLVADAMDLLESDVVAMSGESFSRNIGQCNVAMAVNDLVTLGPRPLVYGQYLAIGEDSWFDREERRRGIIEGTVRGCRLAGCAWGGGETPKLSGIIVPGTADLAGATFGFIESELRLINPANIRDGDAIMLVESSGIHANGLSLARKIAEKLPKGYLTRLGDGRTFGETLLDPTHIYVGVVQATLSAGVKIHGTANITGHGWRKLMRARQPFAYIIDQLPTQLPIFDFMQEHGPVDEKEAYGNLNMGAGFALYVAPDDVEKVITAARMFGQRAFLAGRVEVSDKKEVAILPKGITFSEDTLKVR